MWLLDNSDQKPKGSLRNLGSMLSGILLPVTTPFNVHTEVDAHALVGNLSAWDAREIDGYVILGSTGERVHLDEREYLQVIETARVEVPENPAFIVGAGQQSTISTINEVKKVG